MRVGDFLRGGGVIRFRVYRVQGLWDQGFRVLSRSRNMRLGWRIQWNKKSKLVNVRDMWYS